MSKPDIMNVKVVAAEAPLFKPTGKNKMGRPIMKPNGTKMKKGHVFVVSSTYKASNHDDGNGVVKADGGTRYYFLSSLGDALFVRVNDVAKTDEAVKPIIITGILGVHNVKSGETLSGIAKEYYKNGDLEHYMAIFNANTHILEHPDKIYPGQELQIPKI